MESREKMPVMSLRRGLGEFRREDAPIVTRRVFGHTTCTRRMARGTLHAWLKFVGRFERCGPSSPWQMWLDDYAGFMEVDRGLSSTSRYQYLRVARRYLRWQFRASQRFGSECGMPTSGATRPSFGVTVIAHGRATASCASCGSFCGSSTCVAVVRRCWPRIVLSRANSPLPR